MEEILENSSSINIDRDQLREERKVRKKLKKEAKKLDKQKEQSKLEALYNVRPQGSNVNLITPQFANFAAKSYTIESNNNKREKLKLTEKDFPRIGETSKVPHINKYEDNSNKNENVRILKNDIKRITKSGMNINLLDLINNTTKVHQTKQKVNSTVTTYSGNPLDSSQPQRSKGKRKEGHPNKKDSKLKKCIKEEFVEDANDLPQPLFAYCNKEINLDLENAIMMFLSKIVGFQEKLYKRNPLKGQIKKRCIVGFHEVKKYLKLGKIKVLLIATNIKVMKENDALHCVVKEMVAIAKKENVHYYFALTRRKLGNITLKYIPISCVGILNYDGAEDEYELVQNEYKKVNDVVKCSNSGKITMEPLSTLINNVISTLKDS